MKKTIYQSLLILGIIAFSLNACKKDKTSLDTQDLTSTEENAFADEIFADSFTDITTFSAEGDAFFSSVGNEMQSAGNMPKISTSCAEITVSPRGDKWPKTLTIDFGAGCTVNDITRKGKIVAVYTDRFKKPGAKVTVTFDGYYVNETKIEGTTTITNNGKNAAGNYTFKIDIEKAKTVNNKGTFNLNSTKTIEWFKGENTQAASDDVFHVTGMASGTNTKGKAFSVNITKALVKNVACRFLTEGTVEITTGSHPVRKLDYGDGDCDAKATVTVLEVTKEITLHK